MSSQLVTIPCSMGYFRVKIPLLDCASSPTYEYFCPIPTMEGKTALGASSPANPALHIPEPLSTTRAATSSSHIFASSFKYVQKIERTLELVLALSDRTRLHPPIHFHEGI